MATALRRAGFSDPTLLLNWPEIAGKETARLTQPVRLSGGPEDATLTLIAEPGASLFLQHESRALAERINAYLGRTSVARLRFVQRSIAVPVPLPPVPAADRRTCTADPVHRFKGPKSMKEALLRLAYSRQQQREKTAD